MKIAHKIAVVLSLCFITASSAYSQQKEEIIPFNKRLITTGNGVKSHVTWAKFPSSNEKIRKILLKLTLGTPDENYMSCAHWDYSDKLIIRRVGGIGGDTLNYEMARMLTPYGGNNPKGWSFTWEVDVTDFALLLRDSVELDYVHSGWEPSADRGWALTTNFEVTYGEPAYSPIAIHQVYREEYKYGDASNDIETKLIPFKFKASKKTNYVRSVVIQTGHGMDSLNNSEFSPKWRKLFWNGQQVSHKVLWMEGGDNPLYPQAGTWIYDRGNWIPGTLINPDVCDLLVKGGKQYEYNLDMEPYAIEKPSAVQSIASYLVEYRVNKKRLDVEVADVIVPSLKDIHTRKNPSVEHPVIVVKNHSAKPVETLTIQYGTVGVKNYEEIVAVNIAPFGVAEIRLSNRIDNVYEASESEFAVTVTAINGKADKYMADNSFTSKFKPAAVHKGEFDIILVGNNVSEKDNTMTLYNISTGKKVFDYPLGAIKNNAHITESVKLEDGDYLFEVTDVDGDGLSFWAHQKAGRGECFIMGKDKKIVQYFEPDFGNTVRYWFRVVSSLEKENNRKEPLLMVAYARANVPVFQYRLNDTNGEVKFVIKSHVGKVVDTITRKASDKAQFQLDMTKYIPGRYFVELWQGDYKAFLTVIISEKK